MKRNIVRIKLNNKSLIKISCSGERDYIFSLPKITIKDTYCETHFTVHTKNNRKTFKVTDFGDSKKCFSDYKIEAKEKGYHVTKDIDILKNEIITEQNLVHDVNRIFDFGYLDTGDGFLSENFGSSKTKDDKFSKIIQANIPSGCNAAKVEFFISKNIIENPIYILKSHKQVFDEIFLVHDAIGSDFYIFTIMISYSKKPIKKEK